VRVLLYKLLRSVDVLVFLADNFCFSLEVGESAFKLANLALEFPHIERVLLFGNRGVELVLIQHCHLRFFLLNRTTQFVRLGLKICDFLGVLILDFDFISSAILFNPRIDSLKQNLLELQSAD
jgi:hypothetical protein